MLPFEQLTLWVQGNSIHNLERNECTPDFSCCNKRIRWNRDRREEFARATEAEREHLLIQSLYTVVDEMAGASAVTAEDAAILRTALNEI